VLFFYTEWNSLSNRVVLLRRSPDDCKTWGPPSRISPPDRITNINNDHAIRLRSGRIVLPAFSSPSVWDRNDHFQAFCYFSDDDGRTWQSSTEQMDLPRRGAEEPSIVELKDGSLLAVLRTSLGTIHTARSTNGGVTWSKPAATTLPSPAAPPLVKRIPTTGDLLLVWNRNYQRDHHHQGERTPLSTAISRDDGTTWENLKDIESIPGGAAAGGREVHVELGDLAGLDRGRAGLRGQAGEEHLHAHQAGRDVEEPIKARGVGERFEPGAFDRDLGFLEVFAAALVEHAAFEDAGAGRLGGDCRDDTEEDEAASRTTNERREWMRAIHRYYFGERRPLANVGRGGGWRMGADRPMAGRR
jgi:hypothetical protein